MKRNRQSVALAAILGYAMAASDAPADYAKDVAAYRQGRAAELAKDDGWLTVVGLHWLHEGPNRLGSSPSADVVLPQPMPADAGVITVRGGKAQYSPAGGGNLTINGAPARSTELKPDTAESPDIVRAGPVSFFLIRRSDKLGVRVKDNNSKLRREFAGLRWFPVSPEWRIDARFEPWTKPKKLSFDTVAGVSDEMDSVGEAIFSKGGKEYRLEAVTSGKRLFFVFRDPTAGKTTYSGARFLYTEPAKEGKVILDFNKAVNPPCAFTAYSTCPMAPPQNRLPFPVPAGEMMYRGKS